MSQEDSAFTLAEMLVAISVLVLLVLLLSQLMNSAAAVTSRDNKRVDADSEARPIFERMALDFANMIKRSDVSFYLKTAGTQMPGNDLLGFYSAVQGYYPTAPSPVSVVAYRVNSGPPGSAASNCLERMGKGLDWNGASTTSTPVVFLPLTIHATWPSIASNSAYDDTDPAKRTYEIFGPHVFRFEYYYVERTTGGTVAYPSAWTSLSAVSIQDAATIVVAIAVIDPNGKALLSNSQIATLAELLPDYVSGWGPGELLAHWRSALDGASNMPRPTISEIHIYERCFNLSDR